MGINTYTRRWLASAGRVAMVVVVAFLPVALAIGFSEQAKAVLVGGGLIVQLAGCSARTSAVSELRSRIESGAVGRADLQLVGLLWFVPGSVWSTLAEPLASVF